MKKIIVILLSVCLIFSLAGCKKEEQEKIQYSVGLDENGYYIGLDEKNLPTPDFTSVNISMENVLKHAMLALQESGYAVNDIDTLLDSYIVSYLEYLEVNTKDVIEDTDVVYLSIAFYKDGAIMEDYTSESMMLAADKDGDVIVSGIIGLHPNDEFDIQYTFDDDDEYHPGETVQAKGKILTVKYFDPIESGLIAANIEKIQEEIDTRARTSLF